MRKFGMILAGLVLVLGFSCNIDSKTKDKKTVVVGIEAGMKPPEFELSDLAGKKVALKDYLGKAVLINFFATWCPYCRDEMPVLKEISSRYNIQIITIDIQESQNKVKKFMENAGISHKVLIDQTGSVAKTYQVRGIPTNILIDKKGIIRFYGNNLPDDKVIKSTLK